jgi:hypothetical protein
MSDGTVELNWDSILNKMEKIQELHKRAATQGEMEAAANAMGRLLTKYGLELADVEARLGGRDDSTAHIQEDVTIGSVANWRRSLLNIVARHNFCCVISHTGNAKLTGWGHRSIFKQRKRCSLGLKKKWR